MNNQYVLAIDAGTGSIRSVIFDKSGSQIGVSKREWFHHTDEHIPGSMNFDWQSNWELARECIREVIDVAKIDPHLIQGISTTSMREGIVLYDSTGREIWACANVDARSSKEVEDLLLNHPKLEREIYAKTGQSHALDAIPRLLWVKHNLPEIYDKTSKITMFNDWLIYKLTGKFCVEPSNGSTTGMIDLKTRNWNKEIIEKVGLRTDILPPIIESTKIAGYVSDEASSATRLAKGTPVVVGGGDAQLGCIGINLTANNQAAIFGGSFWQYEVNTQIPKTDPDCRVRVNCHAVPTLWQYEAIAFQPGMFLRWFTNSMCKHYKQLAEKKGLDTYSLLDSEAKCIPVGSHGIFCLFSDGMNYLNWKHPAATFTNFNIDQERYILPAFYRSILESTAYIKKMHMKMIKQFSNITPDSIIFAGGAAQSELWSQILADVLGVKIIVPVIKEASALGAAILAMVGIGWYETIEEAANHFFQVDKLFYPNKEANKTYDSYFQSWQQLVREHLRISEMGLTDYFWSAPGIK